MEDGDVKGRSPPASSADGTRADHARSVCWTGRSAAGVRRLAPPLTRGCPVWRPGLPGPRLQQVGRRRRVLSRWHQSAATGARWAVSSPTS